MLNVHELERAWLKYKIRYYMPIGFAVLALIILSIGSVIFWPKEKASDSAPAVALQTKTSEIDTADQQTLSASKTESATQSVQTPPEVPAQPSPVVAQKPSQPAMENDTVANAMTTTMQPSMGFMQNLESDVMPYYEEQPTIKSKAPTNTVQEVMIEDVKAETPEVAVAAKPVKPIPLTSQPISMEKESSKVTITQQEADDLNDIVKRFKTNKNPALSLFLARRYYDLGSYENAYDYALKTNEIDSDIEESWLIFAKSLVKLGKKEQALKTLQSYINHSRSLSAKNLYNEIQKGVFK